MFTAVQMKKKPTRSMVSILREVCRVFEVEEQVVKNWNLKAEPSVRTARDVIMFLIWRDLKYLKIKRYDVAWFLGLRNVGRVTEACWRVERRLSLDPDFAQTIHNIRQCFSDD
jgi:chromosomal replication initiation ATPase DnaA